LAEQLASARLATAKYATDLHQATADGYQIITRMIPDMGWHFMSPRVQDSTSAAACHYADGTFVPTPSEDRCPARAPRRAPPSGSGTPIS
jgi:hypothetical protein